MKSILVTGGAGYIGSHTCKALARNGYLPITLDNLSTGVSEFVKWGPLVNVDLRNTPTVEQILLEYNVSAVIHFAASAYVSESVQEPAKYYENNIVATHSLLTAMRRSGVSSIVFSSSCATYGHPAVLPITEAALQFPINPYGFSKLVSEREINDFGLAYGLRSVVLRYFNAAGCDPDLEIGELHTPETHLIPNAIFAAMGLGPPLTIFGNDFDTPDGTAIRDFVHVTDLADAHVRALRYLENGGTQLSCNLGTGVGSSVSEIVRAVEACTQSTLPRTYASRRAGDPAKLYADFSRAEQVLGWTPSFRSVKSIISTAVNWYEFRHAGLRKG